MNLKRTEKPWGYEVLWAETDKYVGKILFIKKGNRLSYQYHEIKEESFYLAQGVMEFEYENQGNRKQQTLNAGDNFHIPPLMKHRMIAKEDCTVFEVSTPFLDDLVRLEDEYGRV